MIDMQETKRLWSLVGTRRFYRHLGYESPITSWSVFSVESTQTNHGTYRQGQNWNSTLPSQHMCRRSEWPWYFVCRSVLSTLCTFSLFWRPPGWSQPENRRDGWCRLGGPVLVPLNDAGLRIAGASKSQSLHISHGVPPWSIPDEIWWIKASTFTMSWYVLPPEGWLLHFWPPDGGQFKPSHAAGQKCMFCWWAVDAPGVCHPRCIDRILLQTHDWRGVWLAWLACEDSPGIRRHWFAVVGSSGHRQVWLAVLRRRAWLLEIRSQHAMYVVMNLATSAAPRNYFTTMFWMWTFMVLLNLIMLNLVRHPDHPVFSLQAAKRCILPPSSAHFAQSLLERQTWQRMYMDVSGPCYHIGCLWLHSTRNWQEWNCVSASICLNS